MNQKIYFAGFLAPIICAVSFVAFASTSELDEDFGLGGVFVHYLLDGAFVRDATVQADGKAIILVDNLGHADGEILRLEAYGVLDNSFGSDGFTHLSSPWFDRWVPDALTLQSDGRIVICSNVLQTDDIQGKDGGGFNFDLGVQRYDGNGELDPTFGIGGKSAVVDVSGYGYLDMVAACAVQSNGSILVAGTSFDTSNSYFSLVRYTSKGQLDPSFGKNGKVMTDFFDQERADDQAFTMVIQPDGKIILVGFKSHAAKVGISLARYNKSGALDLSFGEQGKVDTNIDPFDTVTGKDAFIQPDGKIVVTGKVESPEGFNGIIVRYGSDGKMDQAFGDEGVVIIESTSDSPWETNRFAFQPDGKILVSRVQNLSNGGEVFSLIRYSPDGTLDHTFGENGEVHHNLGFSYIEPVKIIPLDDGKVLTVWQAQAKFGNVIVALKYLAKSVDESEAADLVAPDDSATSAPGPATSSDNNSGEQDNNDFPEADNDGIPQDQAGSSQGGCSLHRHSDFFASPLIFLLVTLGIYLSSRKGIINISKN